MAHYRRNLLPGGSYFFTVNLADRRRTLSTDHVVLLRAVRRVRARHPFAVEAAVILPDHLHAIWILPDGDADFATRWRLIKSGFSHALPGGERSPPAAPPKASAGFGSGDIGSIRCATRTILRGTSITSTSIR